MIRWTTALITIAMLGIGTAFLTADEPQADNPPDDRTIAAELAAALNALASEEQTDDQTDEREERRDGRVGRRFREVGSGGQ